MTAVVSLPAIQWHASSCVRQHSRSKIRTASQLLQSSRHQQQLLLILAAVLSAIMCFYVADLACERLLLQ